MIDSKLEPSAGISARDLPKISIEGLGVLSSSASSFATSDVVRLSSSDISSVPEKEVPVPIAGSESP